MSTFLLAYSIRAMFKYSIAQIIYMGEPKQEQKKKKKSLRSRFGKKPQTDELVTDTLSELKDIVNGMKNIFTEFDEGYEAQLEEDRNVWEKMQSKLPSFLQFSDNVKTEERRKSRIKNNKDNLDMLNDSLAKLEIVLTSSHNNFEAMESEYMKAIMPETSGDNQAIKDLETRMDQMEGNIAEAMQHLSGQVRLIKSSMDNMAGQLDEQGVVLEDIDGKIDVLDTKLDKAQELIKKVSKQITNGRLLFLFGFITVTGVFLTQMLK